MYRPSYIFFGSVLTVLAAWFSREIAQPSLATPAYVSGRNNTVLILAGAASGLSNIHVAASYGLQEHAPHVEVHYASFAKREREISRVSATAVRNFKAARPILWHELPGPDYLDAVYKRIGNISGMIFAPGLKGINRLAEGMNFHLDPWERADYIRLYQRIRDLITELDPAAIILDQSLRPALDAARDLNRKIAILTPNAPIDTAAIDQPWAQMLWKFPAQGSGIPYPIPWHLVPVNAYLQVRFVLAYLFNAEEKATRAYYETQGIRNRQHFLNLRSVPWLTLTIPEAGLPLTLPATITECGPIIRNDADVASESPMLHRWLSTAPTVLVNLGSLLKYDEERARIMAQTIATVLQATPNVQVLWKFTKLGVYSDEFLRPVQQYMDVDRLRVAAWLDVEPGALLQSGLIVLSVHHGGANCYHEAIYAGVPQMVLPLWYDCYNYAQLVEYLGVGIWPGKDTAPVWNADVLSDGLRLALERDDWRRNAKRIKEASKQYTGRAIAAKIIAGMAAHD